MAKIKRAAGRVEVALGLDHFGVGRPHAEPDLQAGSVGRLLRGGRSRSDRVLVEQIGELHLTLLEADRACIGKIVRDVVKVELLGRHAASGRVESANHENSFE